MSRSRSNSVPPHAGHVRPSGTNSPIGRSYHASAPCTSNTAAARSTSAGVRRASPHFVQSSAGIGTPQARCREMHQSGLCAIMFDSRSRPHDGSHSTSRSTASSARARSVESVRPRGPSILMNHCEVARKMTGLWQRQQCGYECWNTSWCHSRPRDSRALTMTGLASKTRWPLKSSTVSRKWPPGPTGA